MALKESEVKSIKQSLLGQLDKFPENKRGEIKSQIESMNKSQIEEFVKQNQLTHMPGGCIFCNIAEGKTASFSIDENEYAIAILELNPISRGHVLVVPKKHSDKVLVKINDFADIIKKKIKERFKPKDVIVREIKIMDHALLEVVPIYGDEKDRKQATQEELEEIQKILTGKIKNEEMIDDDSSAEKVVEEVKKEQEKIIELPPRMVAFT